MSSWGTRAGGRRLPNAANSGLVAVLTGAVRGRGLGEQMRAAAPTLAFGPLGARFAITSAQVSHLSNLPFTGAKLRWSQWDQPKDAAD